MLDNADAESAEAAMMYGIIGFGHTYRGKFEGEIDAAMRMLEFISELPYEEEFRVSFGVIMEVLVFRKEYGSWWHWLGYLERLAEQHHDDWTLGELTWLRAHGCFSWGGEPKDTFNILRTATSLFDRVGDAKRANWMEITTGMFACFYGHVRDGEERLRRALVVANELNQEHTAEILLLLAYALIAQQKWTEASSALEQCQAWMENHAFSTYETDTLLGFVELSRGNREVARVQFSDALRLMSVSDAFHDWERKWRLPVISYPASALYGMEAALDDTEAFRVCCQSFREQHPPTSQAFPGQWHLEPAEPAVAGRTHRYEWGGSLNDLWRWLDPDGGCSYEAGDALTIRAPASRDLLDPVMNAPRLLRSVNGDFSAEVTCAPACEDRPGIGGILLWQSRYNYLRLCVGVRAQDEMSLEGCIDDKDVVIGRGRLVDEPVTLRMERIGGRVRALCSADGVTWYSVGEAEFPPVEYEDVGLVAIGFPDRTIYHAPYPDGTAIRFTDFRLWN